MVKVSASVAKAAAFRAVILGAPGSGKGTISTRMVKEFGVTHISSGDKLREHVTNGTDVGKQVKKFMDEGALVPDEIMISLVSHEIESSLNKNYLLDGFPRTLAQAVKLQEIQPVNFVLNLIVPHSVIIDRIKSRWVHMPSGRIYNIGFNDPKVPGKDDETGEPLSQRIDDRPDVVGRRLDYYVSKTEPVIGYYKKLGILKDFRGNTTAEIWPKISEYVTEYIQK